MIEVLSEIPWYTPAALVIGSILALVGSFGAEWYRTRKQKKRVRRAIRKEITNMPIGQVRGVFDSLLKRGMIDDLEESDKKEELKEFSEVVELSLSMNVYTENLDEIGYFDEDEIDDLLLLETKIRELKHVKDKIIAYETTDRNRPAYQRNPVGRFDNVLGVIEDIQEEMEERI
jgi:hypothetical protein